jgi:hypothetical protein
MSFFHIEVSKCMKCKRRFLSFGERNPDVVFCNVDCWSDYQFMRSLYDPRSIFKVLDMG